MHIYAYIFLSSSCHQREIKGVVIRCDKLLISKPSPQKVAKFLIINFAWGLKTIREFSKVRIRLFSLFSFLSSKLLLSSYSDEI